tara:strand:- start:475 stop:702 length:228 start_codon:yes stop_codon:yes gene_type:complete
MSYLAHLKRWHCPSCRWIVKRNNDDELIREVKLVYNPDEYRRTNAEKYGHKARKLYTRKGLIRILENDKSKREKN